MPVSANPWGNLLAQRPQSPESFTADRQAVEAGGITNALNAAKLGEYQQGLQRSEQLRNLLSSGAGSDQLVKGGFLKEGMDLAKNKADVANTNAQESTHRVDAFARKASLMKSSIGSVPSPQAAARYMQQAFADPDMGPVMKQFGTLEEALSEIPQDPAGFQKWQMQASEGIGKLADHAMKQREFDLRANNELIGQDGKINQTLLGAKKQVAQAGAPVQSSVTYQVDGQGNLVALPTKIPNGSGSVSSVPVMSGGKPVQGSGGKGGAATEDERKAAGWLSQADNAWKNMQAAMGGVDQKTGRFKNEDVARPGFADAITAVPSFGLGEVVGNTLRSPERQKFNQAASSLSEAILRAATGAGVNKDEALQKIRELTPVFGEDSATTKQKMDSIPMYLNALKQRAGRAIPQGQGGDFGGGWKIEKVN